MKDRFCPVPFSHVRIGASGKVNICCNAWVKGDAATAGNLQDEDLGAAWNSDKAKAFRQSIQDGSFKFCDANACPSFSNLPKRDAIQHPELRKIIDSGTTEAPMPEIVALNYDYSCTLSCPMCRKEKYMATGEEYNTLMRIHERVTGQIDNPKRLIVTGTGDAFGSKIYRDYLANFDSEKHRDTKLVIRTNSDIFTEKMWNHVKACHNNIGEMQVSVDAARPESYAIIRRGGKFERLFENMNFVGELRKKGKIPRLVVYFTVQLLNFEEIPEMIELAEGWGVDLLSFNQLRPGGELRAEKFTLNSVHFREHPRFNDFVDVMRSVDKTQPFTNFAPGLLRHLPADVRQLFG